MIKLMGVRAEVRGSVLVLHQYSVARAHEHARTHTRTQTDTWGEAAPPRARHPETIFQVFSGC